MPKVDAERLANIRSKLGQKYKLPGAALHDKMIADLCDDLEEARRDLAEATDHIRHLLVFANNQSTTAELTRAFLARMEGKHEG